MPETRTPTQAQPETQPAETQPAQAAQPSGQDPIKPGTVKLTMKRVLAAINDGADDEETVAELNRALYFFGAQDPSLRLPLSWLRVQRRIGLDPDKPQQDRLDGYATTEEVNRFAQKTGLTIGK